MHQWQEFVGLMRLVDRTGADDDGFGLHRIVVGRLGAESHAAGLFAGDVGQVLRDFAGLGSVHRGQAGAEDLSGDAKAAGFGHLGCELLEVSLQGCERHRGQKADIDQQRTGTADPVGIVAAMDMSQVHRRRRNGKGRVIVLLLDFIAVCIQGGHELVHAVKRIVAEPRIARMPGLTQEFDRHRQVALVLSNRGQACGFANNTEATEFFTIIGNQLRTTHGAFLVGGCHQRKRSFEIFKVNPAACRERKRKKTFHVAAAEPVNAVICLAGREWIAAPQGRVTGHGVGMARKHQAVAAATGTRNQVKFIIVYGLDFDLETKAFTPFGHLVDNATVTHIEIRVHAAHRRGRNQGRDHIARGW